MGSGPDGLFSQALRAPPRRLAALIAVSWLAVPGLAGAEGPSRPAADAAASTTDAPPAASAPRGPHLLAWSAAGVAIAGLGVGGFFAYDAAGARGELSHLGPGGVYPTSELDRVGRELDRYERSSRLAAVLLGAGVAAALWSVVVFVVAPRPTAVIAAPGGAGFVFTF